MATMKLLAGMHRTDFLRAVDKARAEADDALNVRSTLVRWSERLAPYLEDSDCTIAEALARWKHDHPTSE